jgi:hypothetical protein
MIMQGASLTAAAINCSLKLSTGEPSCTNRMIGVLRDGLHKHHVARNDFLGIGGPIWLGQPSNIAKRVLERLQGAACPGVATQ